MKTIPLVNNLLIDTFFLSLSTHIGEKPVFMEHTVVLDCREI